MLDHSSPELVLPQTGQIPHDEQVPPPSGQGHVHPPFRVYEAQAVRAHTRQDDHLLLSALEGIHGGHLHRPQLGMLEM